MTLSLLFLPQTRLTASIFHFLRFSGTLDPGSWHPPHFSLWIASLFSLLSYCSHHAKCHYILSCHWIVVCLFSHVLSVWALNGMDVSDGCDIKRSRRPILKWEETLMRRQMMKRFQCHCYIFQKAVATHSSHLRVGKMIHGDWACGQKLFPFRLHICAPQLTALNTNVHYLSL